MARQSNGNYLQPANTAAVSGQTIVSTAFNTLITDIGTEITNSVDRGGRSAMQAALPMGANKITGVADPTVPTDASTKNYVDTTVASFFSTGDVKPTFKIVPDAGWLLMDDGTFGSASSGSSNSNNIANQALFTLFFNAPFTDANVPIFTSGGGATTRAAQTSASAAWAANCRMSLPKALGRALGIAGAGSGLTARAVGAFTGLESVSLIRSDLPNVAPTFTGTNDPVTITISGGTVGGTFAHVVQSGGGASVPGTATAIAASANFTPRGTIQDINGAVTQTAHNNMQPTTFLNVMVKL